MSVGMVLEGGEFSEVSEFLAEITFYFVDNHLVFSSVTPGYFSADLTSAPEMDRVTNLYTVNELEELNPEVFTVSEVLFEGEPLRQVMVAAQPLPEETDHVLNAFYFFVVEEDIKNFAYLSFNDVSQDFPSNSILLFNSYFNEILNQQD
ncbi:hypothetical protein LZ578_05845 [Jeotgalibaca sp. MA1X17-3]|uniref:hypothetical protein n=1 Tax=Jeotgalibaca sp. MA1X17-3 TaxID=2908211 RepID=UPI001F2FA3D8|nr:hypothetical protein [Jeotgalibaca sp. MA1X17-3]UJF16608.1 hypothetical protein LZ578_05845 [Jeotgalibaca sp. MA1X17-3]